MGGSASAAEQAEREANRELHSRPDDEEAIHKIPQKEQHLTGASNSSSDDELHKKITRSKVYSAPRKVVVSSLSRPFFHLDLTAALQSAIANIENDRTARRTLSTAEQEPPLMSAEKLGE